MTDLPSEEEEKQVIGDKTDGEVLVPSDDEDDCEGYFLEPAGTNVNIAEKIAEANKKLLEEGDEGEDDDCRPRKVQFSEELVNFEPIYYSAVDIIRAKKKLNQRYQGHLMVLTTVKAEETVANDDYTESAQNSVISEEDLEFKSNQDEAENSVTENEPVTSISTETEECKPEEDIPDDIPEELDSDVIPPSKDIIEELSERNPKFILVLLPKEQNSSCESIIGEEIPEEKTPTDEKKPEPEKPIKTKMARPKSAKKSCEVSKISPNLSYSSAMERKSWQTNQPPITKGKPKAEGSEKKGVFVGEIKVQIKGRLLKKINIDDLSLENTPKTETLKRCCSRPRSCYTGRSYGSGQGRPKTAPIQRTCCVLKTELPQYNGLRSEYGLSAEQLQERKQKALENKQKKKQEEIKKKQEVLRKRNENEETFQKWLFNKTKKTFKKKSLKLTDTLTRSDVYIQTHASYAANRSVPYSLDYNLNKKINNRKREIRGKKNKTILVEKLFNSMTPHLKKSFNIYLGVQS